MRLLSLSRSPALSHSIAVWLVPARLSGYFHFPFALVARVQQLPPAALCCAPVPAAASHFCSKPKRTKRWVRFSLSLSLSNSLCLSETQLSCKVCRTLSECVAIFGLSAKKECGLWAVDCGLRVVGLIFAFSFILCFCLVAVLFVVVVCFGFSLANCFKILYVLRFYLSRGARGGRYAEWVSRGKLKRLLWMGQNFGMNENGAGKCWIN